MKELIGIIKNKNKLKKRILVIVSNKKRSYIVSNKYEKVRKIFSNDK